MITAAAWDMAGPIALGGLEVTAVGMIAVAVAWRNLEPVIVVLGSALAGLAWWRCR